MFPQRRSLILLGSISIVLLIVLGLVTLMYVNQQRQLNELQQGKTAVTSTSETSSSSTTSETTTSTTVKTYKLYLSKDPESYDDFTRVFAIDRQTSRADVATFLIEEYLKGPTSSERAQGYFNEDFLINENDCGSGRVFTLNIVNRVATLKFCGDDSAALGAAARAGTALRQNIIQFNTVDKVIMLDKDGNCLFDESGLNACLD